MEFFRRMKRVLLNTLFGLKCDRCGHRPARLVVETGPPRMVRGDAATGRKESVREVHRMEVVCRNCEP